MLVDQNELQKIFKASDTTLKKYRKIHWDEGIYWFRVNSRKILYNLDLIQDWLENRNTPHLHEKTLKKYLKK